MPSATTPFQTAGLSHTLTMGKLGSLELSGVAAEASRRRPMLSICPSRFYPPQLRPSDRILLITTSDLVSFAQNTPDNPTCLPKQSSGLMCHHLMRLAMS